MGVNDAEDGVSAAYVDSDYVRFAHYSIRYGKNDLFLNANVQLISIKANETGRKLTGFVVIMVKQNCLELV